MKVNEDKKIEEVEDEDDKPKGRRPKRSKKPRSPKKSSIKPNPFGPVTPPKSLLRSMVPSTRV